MKFTSIAMLVAVASAKRLSDAPAAPAVEPVPWDKDTLPDCPADKTRTKMDDFKTHVVKYPYVGATCKKEIKKHDVTLIMTSAPDPFNAEHCPDFNERFTLVNGRTRAIPYPQKGWNCNPEWSL